MTGAAEFISLNSVIYITGVIILHPLPIPPNSAWPRTLLSRLDPEYAQVIT
jgi:hypothetical protein